MSLADTIKLNLNNIRGWRSHKKIIVFESDDWGSIRMPNKETYQSLLKKGIKADDNNGWYLDCLESDDDIQNLVEMISKYKDVRNQYPIFTMNTVMGNPDFEQIKKSKYDTYYFEHFFNSYKTYHGKDMQGIWKNAIHEKLIYPQFHAREHIHVNLWLRDLKNGLKDTRVAFDLGFFGLITKTSSRNQRHYLSAFRAESPNELESIKNIIADGLNIFEKTFGFRSKTFIPCNYVLPKSIEPFLRDKGLLLLQSQRGQIEPDPDNYGKIKISRRFMGQINNIGQIYTVRNVKFEPFENQHKDWVSETLKEIKNAFFWNKPAIISSHRINYVGGIDIKHRDRNLKTLDILLKKIVKHWPDVIFLSSDQLLSRITNKD